MRFKICEIASSEEAEQAIRSGASGIGLLYDSTHGAGGLELEEILTIAREVPPLVEPILVTSSAEPWNIVQEIQESGCTAVQLSRALSLDDYEVIRTASPSIRLIQVIYVDGVAAIDRARLAAASGVHALTLDTPSVVSTSLGGTGQTHDWSVSARICTEVNLPVILAGGIRSSNVAEATSVVRPFAVDLSTGVRDHNRTLDPDLLSAFAQAVAPLG